MNDSHIGLPARAKLSVEALILTLRGQRVILDSDLAALYGVTTKALNQAVKRNQSRFPRDFMFQLAAREKTEVVTNCDHLAALKFSKQRPWAFTEHGAIMAASVLSTQRAVTMSLYVVRTFVKMREKITTDHVILQRLAEIDHTLLRHDLTLREVWQKLQPLLQPPALPEKKPIGFGSR